MSGQSETRPHGTEKRIADSDALREAVQKSAIHRLEDRPNLPRESYLDAVDKLLIEQLPSILPVWNDSLAAGRLVEEQHRLDEAYERAVARQRWQMATLIFFGLAGTGFAVDTWLAGAGARIWAVAPAAICFVVSVATARAYIGGRRNTIDKQQALQTITKEKETIVGQHPCWTAL